MSFADPNCISKEDFLAFFGHGDMSYSENARARAQKQEEKTRGWFREIACSKHVVANPGRANRLDEDGERKFLQADFEARAGRGRKKVNDLLTAVERQVLTKKQLQVLSLLLC